MKEYRKYCCDYCYEPWIVFCDEADPEKDADNYCSLGHEAVTLQKCRLLDVVEVAIRPAAQIVDSVKGQIGHEYEYYLVVRDLHTNEERMSRHSFSWSEIKDELDKFRNVSRSKAWKIIDKLDRRSES